METPWKRTITAPQAISTFLFCRRDLMAVGIATPGSKGKGNVHPRTGHVSPEGE